MGDGTEVPGSPSVSLPASGPPFDALRGAAARLELGGGTLVADGFICVDLRPEADVRADASRLPFADGTVVEMRAMDLLEHFPASRTQAVLAEWRRVLTPGGRLTVKVPNLFHLARFIVADPANAGLVIRNIYGGHRWGPDGAWDTHHTGWTPELLEVELSRAGFGVESNDLELNMTAVAVRLDTTG